MAIPSFNLTGNLDLITTSDTGANWDVTDVDADIKVEGVGAGFDAIRDGGTLTYTFPAAVDMSAANSHVRIWLQHLFAAFLETKALGGIQLFVTDGTGTNAYYVGGSDTYSGGFVLFQADLSVPDVNGAANLAAITQFGFTLVHAVAARNVANTYWDLASYGFGYEFFGGTSGDKVTWITVANADTSTTASLQYGVVSWLYSGAMYLNSGLFIGDSATTADTYFDGTDETIIFYSANEKSGTYKLVGTGNATGVTHIDFSKSVIKSAGTPFSLDMSGTNVTSFTMNGATLANASTVTLNTTQVVNSSSFSSIGSISQGGSSFDNCSVSASGLVTVTGGSFTGNNIIDSIVPIAVTTTSLDTIAGNTFTSGGTGHAVELTDIGTGIMAWDNTLNGYAGTNGSTGNESVYVNVASGTIDINVSAGSSIPTIRTAGATVNVVSALISFTFNVNPVITNYEYRIYTVTALGSLAGSVEVQGLEDATLGSYTYQYPYSADTPVAVQIIGHTNDYIESITYYTLTASDQDVTVLLSKDINN